MRIDPDRITKAREAAGLTPWELCRQADVTPSALWRITSGRGGSTIKTAARLAAALGVTVDALIDAPIEAPTE